MGYVIGSWNTRHFSGVGTHDTGKIAEVILSEGFDIVALQEVKRAEAIEFLKRRLPEWEGCHGQPRTRERDEEFNLGFAFLWNTKRVRECSKDGRPIIFDMYKSQTVMTRNPYYGRFTPNGLLGGSFFEIRLINIHLWFGKDLALDKQKRLEEFKLVTRDIYSSLSHRRYGDNMPAYTVVLGDYNFCAVICHLQENDTAIYFAGTKQEEKTTLSTKNEVLVNDYDHFGYNDNRFSATGVTIERVDSVSKYMNNDFDLHMKKLSDHVPIKMELILNQGR